MNNIQPDTRRPFFPRRSEINQLNGQSNNEKNSTSSINKTLVEGKDDYVDIDEKTIDFLKAKKAVFESPTIDKKDKVDFLKNKIKKGNYTIDYDGLAEKMIHGEY